MKGAPFCILFEDDNDPVKWGVSLSDDLVYTQCAGFDHCFRMIIYSKAEHDEIAICQSCAGDETLMCHQCTMCTKCRNKKQLPPETLEKKVERLERELKELKRQKTRDKEPQCVIPSYTDRFGNIVC